MTHHIDCVRQDLRVASQCPSISNTASTRSVGFFLTFLTDPVVAMSDPVAVMRCREPQLQPLLTALGGGRVHKLLACDMCIRVCAIEQDGVADGQMRRVPSPIKYAQSSLSPVLILLLLASCYV